MPVNSARVQMELVNQSVYHLAQTFNVESKEGLLNLRLMVCAVVELTDKKSVAEVERFVVDFDLWNTWTWV